MKSEAIFIAPNATVLGQVTLEKDVSVWYNSVIRGDSDQIHIGAGTNIQDGCILHVDPGAPIQIGRQVIVGHGAIIHGASIGDHSLIGMRATILNHAKIGKYCVIGAHALITENMEIPDYSLVMGTPGKVVKTIDEATQRKLEKNAAVYIELAKQYKRNEFNKIC